MVEGALRCGLLSSAVMWVLDHCRWMALRQLARSALCLTCCRRRKSRCGRHAPTLTALASFALPSTGFHRHVAPSSAQ